MHNRGGQSTNIQLLNGIVFVPLQYFFVFIEYVNTENNEKLTVLLLNLANRAWQWNAKIGSSSPISIQAIVLIIHIIYI